MSLTDMVLMPGKDYQDICDTLRESLGTETPITSDMVSPMIQNIAKAMGNEDGLITGSLPAVYENDRVTSVRAEAFREMKKVSVIQLPKVVAIGQRAFASSEVERIHMPRLENTSTYILDGAGNLQFADMGLAKTLYIYAFRNAKNLKTVVLRRNDAPTVLSSTRAFEGTPFYGPRIGITANGSFVASGELGFRPGTGDTDYVDNVQDQAAVDGCAVRIRPSSTDTYRVKLRTSAGNSGEFISSAEVLSNANDGKYHRYKVTLTMPTESLTYLKIYAFSDYLQVTGGLLDKLASFPGEKFDVYFSMKVENTEEDGLVFYVERMIVADHGSDIDTAGGTVYVPETLIERYKKLTNWSALYSGGSLEFVKLEGSGYE